MNEQRKDETNQKGTEVEREFEQSSNLVKSKESNQTFVLKITVWVRSRFILKINC